MTNDDHVWPTRQKKILVFQPISILRAYLDDALIQELCHEIWRILLDNHNTVGSLRKVWCWTLRVQIHTTFHTADKCLTSLLLLLAHLANVTCVLKQFSKPEPAPILSEMKSRTLLIHAKDLFPFLAVFVPKSLFFLLRSKTLTALTSNGVILSPVRLLVVHVSEFSTGCHCWVPVPLSTQFRASERWDMERLWHCASILHLHYVYCTRHTLCRLYFRTVCIIFRLFK